LGVGGWGFGVWVRGPTPQSPIPNPQSPFYYKFLNFEFFINIIKKIFL